MIGAAVDLTSSMKPFDSPALAGAKIEAKKTPPRVGPVHVKVCDHQLKNQKQCAAQLIQAGAKIALVTCDVEYAAPAVQEFINKGILTVSPCVTTDQMGRQRFGAKGKLAFTMGSTAQDEGSVEAEYAYSRGWRTRSSSRTTCSSTSGTSPTPSRSASRSSAGRSSTGSRSRPSTRRSAT